MNQRSETYELLLRKSYERIEELEAQVAALRRDAQEPIAIIGLGCRFPGADNPQAFWNLLRAGRDAIQEVPEDRWDIDAIYNPDPNAEGSICTRFGGFINHVSEFDPQFFDITPREAYSLDPQQRLLLETSWETLEHAGLTPPNLPARTGVFVGISNVDHREALIRCEPANINGYFASGNTASMASGRLAYFLGINGPCLSIDTACSSSLVAVHVAVLSLRHRDCELALAGGVNCILTPHESISLSRSGMLSPKGRCQAFDAAADGYVRGEGCGMILLKRLSDALAEGDNVLAIIRGSAMNQDGRTSGLTVPNGLSQQAVIREALADGMVAPEEVDYLEAHGTGTSLGDPIEVGALGAVFGRRQNPLWVGSVKTNIGHLEAAAGIASLIKVVLALQAGEIPPQLHFQHPSPLISWEQWPIRIVNENVPWPQNRRIAGISSFSFSGTNCHLIVGEAPAKNSGASSVDRGHYVLALSAKTPQALHQLAGRYLDYLHSAHGVSLADICFSANTGRSHFRHRFAAVGASGADLCAQFESFRRRDQSDNSDSPPKVAFLFTGQGVQEDGMGRELFATQPAFRVAMEQCAAIVDPWLEHPLIDVIYSGRLAGTMRQAVYAPPALFALEYALTQLWLSWGVKPEMLLGHSLGEYVAACVAGVFSLADGLRLAVERGRLTQALALPGTMIAVRATPAEVGPWLARYPQTAIAAFNGPRSLVLSGPEENVRALAEELGGKGLVYRNLAVTHAFHSPLMESVQAAFAKLAIQIRYLPPKITLVSNLSGAVAGEELCNSSYWVHHLREPVRFAEGMETLRQ
ncbi:MAG TPA: type I polyketide synthase, partial [Chthoniobacterales bacterium]|nr:type I polyketide synthase [Chthoniobacterales bacterium]